MDESSETFHRLLRVLFNVALAGWFYVIGFWLGPNELTFHKLEGMTAQDLVPIVQEYCVPVVREMKIYARDKSPTSENDLFALLDSHQGHGPGGHRIAANGNYQYWGPGNVLFKHTIEYDFTPGHEGWSVHGPYVNGPLPVPPVTLELDAKPMSGQ